MVRVGEGKQTSTLSADTPQVSGCRPWILRSLGPYSLNPQRGGSGAIHAAHRVLRRQR